MDYTFEKLTEAYETLWEWELSKEGSSYLLKDSDGALCFTFSSFEELATFTKGEDDLEAYLEELYA